MNSIRRSSFQRMKLKLHHELFKATSRHITGWRFNEDEMSQLLELLDDVQKEIARYAERVEIGQHTNER